MIRYAAAYPAVKFQLFVDEKLLVNTEGRGDRESVMRELFDLQTARQLLKIDMEEEDYRVEGFTSPISLTRSNRKEITFFVNGRWIVDATLNTALVQAYHTYLMVGRYPLAALFLELPPGDLDVNVHPAKAEVRFRFPDRVFSMVQRSVRRALLSQSTVPQFTGRTWQPFIPVPTEPRSSDIEHPKNSSDVSGAQATPSGPPLLTNSVQTPFTFGGLPLLRLVGQIGAAYLVAEGPDGLYLSINMLLMNACYSKDSEVDTRQGISPRLF